ncbi:MAG: hypothetical protein AAF492_22560, partial [Verrucomicrobiota bacterium]
PPPPRPITFTKEYRMSSIKVIEGAGISVGLVELKTQRSIILEVGDRDELSGLELVDADYSTESAVLKLGADEAKFTLQGVVAAPTPSRTRNPFRPPQRKLVTRSSGSRTKLPRPAPATSRFKTQEELREHLQNYAEKAIRERLPALPIQLTREQDDRLVRDGYLPEKQ